MPFYDNIWHTDAHENISLPACLTVFVKVLQERTYRISVKN